MGLSGFKTARRSGLQVNMCTDPVPFRCRLPLTASLDAVDQQQVRGQCRWVIRVEPAFDQLVAEKPGRCLTTCWIVGLELGLHRFAKATALAAMTCIRRATLNAGRWPS